MLHGSESRFADEETCLQIIFVAIALCRSTHKDYLEILKVYIDNSERMFYVKCIQSVLSALVILE